MSGVALRPIHSCFHGVCMLAVLCTAYTVQAFSFLHRPRKSRAGHLLVLTNQLSWTLFMTFKTLEGLCSSSPGPFPRQQTPVFELQSSVEQSQTSVQTMCVRVFGQAGGTLTSKCSLQLPKRRVFFTLNSANGLICKCIFRF